MITVREYEKISAADCPKRLRGLVVEMLRTLKDFAVKNFSVRLTGST